MAVQGMELVEGDDGQLYVVGRVTRDGEPGYLLSKVTLTYVDVFRRKWQAVRRTRFLD
jgi:hypothetical protein